MGGPALEQVKQASSPARWAMARLGGICWAMEWMSRTLGAVREPLQLWNSCRLPAQPGNTEGPASPTRAGTGAGELQGHKDTTDQIWANLKAYRR
jgi:hypothetical protein